MINQGKFRDNTNFLKFAGKTTKLTGDNVLNSIKQDGNRSDSVKLIKNNKILLAK